MTKQTKKEPETHEVLISGPEHKKSSESKALSDVERVILLDKAREQLQSRDEQSFSAYLVSLESLEDDPVMIQEELQELGSLVRTLGDVTLGAMVQKKSKMTPATLIGPGKAEELKQILLSVKADYVVFNQELSPTQVRNLESIVQKPVLDRSGIILQIFRNNAKSREAKTQVEIAHLEYLAPRISNSWIAFERQRSGGAGGGGGARLRGAGETHLELERRRIHEKISNLKKELLKIQKERRIQRKDRKDEFMVILLGYTNAGKTSLMNGLTESQLSSKDALFETLDSTVRILKGSQNLKILVTDTVGFIRNLPHGLVASFRSTLEEVALADLVLHVVDISHPHYKEHIKVTQDVLKEVGASDVPSMMVFNKVDKLINEPRLPRILARTYPGSICVSMEIADDIKRLRDHIIAYFEKDLIETSVFVDHKNSALLSKIFSVAKVVSSDWTPEGGTLKIRISREQYHLLVEPQSLTSDSDSNDHLATTDLWQNEGFQKKEKL